MVLGLILFELISVSVEKYFVDANLYLIL